MRIPTRRSLVGVAAGALVLGGLALGAASAAAQSEPKPQSQVRDPAPPQISGEVVSVDRSSGRVRVKDADGTLREFQASDATLADLQVGDRIQAKKRPEGVAR